MAKIRGTTGVGATIAPASNKAKYPATSEQWHKGGFKSFANTAERDALLPSYRKDGMHCYIVGSNEYYRWSEGQSSWIKVYPAQGSSGAISDNRIAALQQSVADLVNLVTQAQLGVRISAAPNNKLELKEDGLYVDALSKDEMAEFDIEAYKTQLKAELKAEILAELKAELKDASA